MNNETKPNDNGKEYDKKELERIEKEMAEERKKMVESLQKLK